MRYSEVLIVIPSSPVFSTQQLLMFDDSLSTQNLLDRTQAGHIIQLKRWRYSFTDRLTSEKDIYHIAWRIVQPSYISLESVLNLYNLIPEAIIQSTSITTKKTQSISSDIGLFSYRSIDTDLFWWYELSGSISWWYYIASIEKALLDYFYYHNELDNKAAFQEWRILPSEFHEQVDRELFDLYLKRFDNKAMTKRVSLFLDYIDHA